MLLLFQASSGSVEYISGGVAGACTAANWWRVGSLRGAGNVLCLLIIATAAGSLSLAGGTVFLSDRSR